MKNVKKPNYRTCPLECDDVTTIFRDYEVIDLFVGHNPREKGYTWLFRNKFDNSFHIVSEDYKKNWMRKGCIQRWGMPPVARECHRTGDYIPLIKGLFTDIKIEKNGNNIWRSNPHVHVKRGVTEWRLTVGSRPMVSWLVHQDFISYWSITKNVDCVDFTQAGWDLMFGMKITNIKVVDNEDTVTLLWYVMGDHEGATEKSRDFSPKLLFTFMTDFKNKVDVQKCSNHPFWHLHNIALKEEVSKWDS